MLEGSLCWQLIYWHYINTIEYYCEGKKKFCQVLKDFLTEASTNTRQIAKEREAYDPYWHQVSGTYYYYIYLFKKIQYISFINNL
jgi:hypothetical protein